MRARPGRRRTVADLVLRAGAGGLDAVWVGDHHVTDRHYLANFGTLAYLAGVTDDVGLGTAVCLAPLHNPAALVERVATLDVRSGGRVTLGVGLGDRFAAFATFGDDPAARVPRLHEYLSLARRLWSEDGVTFEGRTVDVEGLSATPNPVQPGGPDGWLGGGVAAAVERAAAHGDARLPGPATRWDDLSALYEAYDAARETPPSARSLWRDLFVAESRAAGVENDKPALVGTDERYADWGAAGDR